MLLRSNPKSPGSMALLGDFAIQQNTSDRSKTLLNEVLDGTFKPMHEVWNAHWINQQRTEDAVAESLTLRDAAGVALDLATARVLAALEFTQGNHSPILQQYLPNGNLSVTRRSFSKQLTEMEPYAQAIGSASDAIIPSQTREAFMRCFADAKAAESQAAATKKRAIEAQRARAALDVSWKEAYRAYHRAVEYTVNGDRGLIKTWIREWPLPATPVAAKTTPEEPVSAATPDSSAAKVTPTTTTAGPASPGAPA